VLVRLTDARFLASPRKIVMFSIYVLKMDARADKLGVAAVTMRRWADVWRGN
jgi:hypothetical protein